MILFHVTTFQNSLLAQQNSRILFLLDGSGSMNQKMGEKTRFEIARNLLYNLADSLKNSKPKVEIGIRVFGHQYTNQAHNCTDSKLEIPFAINNAEKIKQRLKTIQPKGYTPIAYSLFKAAEQDFPNATSKNSEPLNAIVLITDGVETCDGNPCTASALLEKQRIALKPFIIGLGLQDSFIKKFDCIGTYFDAKTEDGFRFVLKSVVSQIMNSTTVQINLIDSKGAATETNVEITFTDAYSNQLKYALVHALNEKGISDTVKIDPIGKYNLLIHTTPPLKKENIALIPGVHNIIAADVPQGNLQLSLSGTATPMAAQMPPNCLVRKVNETNIINTQEFGAINRYLAGEYDLEILCLPPIEMRGVLIKAQETKTIFIPAAGTASVFFNEPGLASIYTTEMGRWKKIHDWGNVTQNTYELHLQPADYDIVFIPLNKHQSESTISKHIKISSGTITRTSFKE